MKKFGILLIFAGFLFCGCATPTKPMYYWEDYSHSLYKYKKVETDENLQAHKKTLEKIIGKSKENGVRVPPGIYCEYGFILTKEGKINEGQTYLTLEEQTYPESQVFIQRLQGKAKGGKE